MANGVVKLLTCADGLVQLATGGLVNLADLANAGANSVLLGAGDAGSGSPYAEISLGSGLAISGTTLSATGSGGTVTSVSGTANEVAVATGTTTPVISLTGPHGFATQTNHGILLGQGTGAIVATAVLSDGQLIVGQTSADPLPKTLSGSGCTATLSAAGVLTITSVANASLSNSSVTISGHALSLGGTLNLTASDVSLGNVTNDAQTKAAVVPNTAPSAGQVLVGNAGGTAYAPVSASGDATLASTGALTLATVATAGTTGGSTAIPVVTINAKGLVTSITTAAVVAPAGTLTGTTLAANVVTSSLTSLGTQGAALDMGSHLIHNVTDPAADQDVATRIYVDNAVAALAAKDDAIYATTAALAAYTYNNGSSGVGATITLTVAAVLVIGGGTPTVGQRVLIKDETGGNAPYNGIYSLTTAGVLGVTQAVLTRTTDFDLPGDGINGALIAVIAGTNAGTLWYCTATGNITFGTTNITFSAFTGTTYTADESTLHLSGTTFSIKSTYIGQTSVTTLGTITTGVWNGTTIAIANGGTGQTTAVAAKDALTVKGADIASATTTDLSAATGELVFVTGTNTITGLGTLAAGAERVVKFTGALTLTHNATSLILPGAANITTAASDRAVFRSLGSGNWLCIDYVRATAPPVSGTNTGDQTITLTGDVTGSGTGSFAATIANSAVTLAKIANAAANSKLLGSGASGSGAAYVELTLGTNLTMSGTTLNAAGGGSGSVTTVSVVTANGVSGSVANPTTTPAITLTLGAITPTQVTCPVIHASVTDTNTNIAVEVLQKTHDLSSGTAADGFGISENTYLQSSTSADQLVNEDIVTWATAAHATRKGRRVWKMWDTAGRECLRIEASGTAAMIGFLGAAATAAQASPDICSDYATRGLATGTPTVASANLTGNTTNQFISLQDQKAQNTAGGTFTTGAWRTRTLNTKATDTGSNCTLASNQFTLSAGTYRIRASAPGQGVDRHQIRLQNVTAGTTLVVGTSEYAPAAAGVQTRSFLEGRFTVTASQALEIQHDCNATGTTTGFGLAANFTTEVYTMVELEKEAT